MARARNIDEIEAVQSRVMPSVFLERFGDRAKRKLGDAYGLTQYGVNHVTLGPGGQSSLRHWHTLEDELIYVLGGELVLVTNDGEQVLHAGDVVGFRAGDEDAHHMINRSSEPATYLEVGTRIEPDTAVYPDDDAKWEKRDGKWAIVHKDGTPY
jgi:uncharacterized cupin superfamily protein